METKWMCHPTLPGQEIEVPEQAVDHYAHSGWLLMDGPPERDEPDSVARATVRGEPYDSGESADAKSMEAPSKTDDDSSESSDEKSDDKSDDDKPTTSRTRRASSTSKKGDDK